MSDEPLTIGLPRSVPFGFLVTADDLDRGWAILMSYRPKGLPLSMEEFDVLVAVNAVWTALKESEK